MKSATLVEMDQSRTDVARQGSDLALGERGVEHFGQGSRLPQLRGVERPFPRLARVDHGEQSRMIAAGQQPALGGEPFALGSWDGLARLQYAKLDLSFQPGLFGSKTGDALAERPDSLADDVPGDHPLFHAGAHLRSLA